MLPLSFQLFRRKSVKYRFIKFFVFDFGSLHYLLSLFFWSGVTLPLVALDEKLLSKRDAERLNTTVQPAKSIYHKKKNLYLLSSIKNILQ